MPEQLTKHPEVTLKVLRSAGAKCGDGEPQAILTQCPVERFCKLPGGEVCIYGLPEAGSMTQITGADWRAVAQVTQGTQEAGATGPMHAEGGQWGWLGTGLAAGLLLGALAMKILRR